MFRAGQLHVTSNVPADKISTYRKSNSTELKIAPYLGTYFYRLNIKTPQLQDRRVRRALGMAIDREKLVENITKGGQIPAYTMTPPGTMGYYPNKHSCFRSRGRKKLAKRSGLS